MTAVQQEYVALYEKGYGVREIARMLGKAPSVVSSGTKRAHQPKKTRAKSITCPYSSSCFTCPLADCTQSSENVNLLPPHFDYVKEVEGA